jgi:transposase
MTKKPQTSKDAAEKLVKNIRRKAQQTNSAKERLKNLPPFIVIW